MARKTGDTSTVKISLASLNAILADFPKIGITVTKVGLRTLQEALDVKFPELGEAAETEDAAETPAMAKTDNSARPVFEDLG